MKYILQLIIAIYLIPFAFAEDDYTKVARVVDGDTILTTDGDYVRLLDINTPEIAHKKGEKSQPFGIKAAKELRRKLPKQTEIHLIFGKQKFDRYNRLLAHVYNMQGEWINAHMVRKGLAHVYSFPDNAFKAEQLYPIEQHARDAKLGIWSLPRWQILDATKPVDDSKIGQFNIVEGRILNTAYVKGITYLNFGTDWRTDFSLEIPAKFLTKFKQKNINPLTYYKLKKVRVRGRLKPVNGTLITLTHPEQLTVLEELD